jgi:hypothetical protein
MIATGAVLSAFALSAPSVKVAFPSFKCSVEWLNRIAYAVCSGWVSVSQTGATAISLRGNVTYAIASTPMSGSPTNYNGNSSLDFGLRYSPYEPPPATTLTLCTSGCQPRYTSNVSALIAFTNVLYTSATVNAIAYVTAYDPTTGQPYPGATALSNQSQVSAGSGGDWFSGGVFFWLTQLPDTSTFKLSSGERVFGSTFTDGLSEMYFIISVVAGGFFAAAIVFAVFQMLLGNFGLADARGAYRTFANVLLYTVVIYLGLNLWSLVSAGLNYSAQFVISPTNPALCSTSPIQGCPPVGQLFASDPRTIMDIISTLSGTTLILALVKLMLAILVPILGIARIFFTALFVAAIPILLGLQLIPFTKSLSQKLLDTLSGLTLSGLFAAVILKFGVIATTSGSWSQEPIVEVVEIVTLAAAAFIPVVLAPVFGSVWGTLGTMVTGATVAAALPAISAGGGAVIGSGILGSASSIAGGRGIPSLPGGQSQTSLTSFMSPADRQAVHQFGTQWAGTTQVTLGGVLGAAARGYARGLGKGMYHGARSIAGRGVPRESAFVGEENA